MKNLILSSMLLSVVVAYGQNEFPDSIQMQELSEVTIQGEKPQISAHDGILTVDLPTIVKDKPVSNILEALYFIPGVIDNNGVLTLNGAGNVTLILNGEPTNMPIQNLYQLLYSTPIDRLKNVEVMYAAPAKYHVSGAVLNIVFKTPRAIDGLMGQLRTSYTHKHYSSYFGGLSATYSVKDWIFDVNWSMTKDKNWNRQKTYSNHLLDGERIMIEDDMRQVGKSMTNNLYTSIAYKTLKLTYYGQYNSDSHNKSIANGTFGQYINKYSYLSQPTYHNIALRYLTPFGLSLGGDFTSYSESRTQIMTKEGDEMLNANNKQDIAKYHIYADQEHKLGEWHINYGVEYQHSNDHSLQNYIFPHTEGFDDILKEDVADAYIGVQGSFKWGLT